nr:MAG TPA: hypothetical protein [Caudoviricetes sp.]
MRAKSWISSGFIGFTSFLPPQFYHGRGRRTRQMFERQKPPAGPGEERG